MELKIRKQTRETGESESMRWLVKVGGGGWRWGGHLAGSDGKCEVPAVPPADYCFVFRIVSFSAVCCACVCVSLMTFYEYCMCGRRQKDITAERKGGKKCDNGSEQGKKRRTRREKRRKAGK